MKYRLCYNCIHCFVSPPDVEYTWYGQVDNIAPKLTCAMKKFYDIDIDYIDASSLAIVETALLCDKYDENP